MFVDGGSVQRQKQGKGDRYMVVDAGGRLKCFILMFVYLTGLGL